MRYISTRRPVGDESSVSFEEAVLTGLAPDGGLYVPETIPNISLGTLVSFADLPFHELAFEIFKHFVDETEIPSADLKDILRKSFATFSHPSVAPLVKLPVVQEGNAENLWVLELFHGPTFAFKDVALQVLGNLFEFFLDRKRSALPVEDKDAVGLTILGATSGDTGGAAIYGLRGKKGIDVFILHPKGRVSPIQELQMTTVLDANVHNVAVEGTFDDCQEIVKTLFSDPAFKKVYQLGAVNSINWARILSQTSYYFYSYFEVLRALKVPFKDAHSYAALTKIQYR
jgi:threonine synthase